MTVITEARNATLADLAEILQNQQDAKHDFVAPATTLRMKGGMLHAKDSEVELSEDGVTTVNGIYRPTGVFDEGVAAKLGVPLAYVRRMRRERPDLYDANVNGWLHGKTVMRSANADGGGALTPDVIAPADARSFLIRTFKGDPGVGRALLSDVFAPIDNFDVLTAALDGIRQSGITPNIDRCDLTDRRMYVTVSAPEVAVAAPVLLAGYRNPFTDAGQQAARHGYSLNQWREVATREGLNYTEDEGGEPIVWAGFVISNSEVGAGAFSITPRLVVKVCKNGLTIPVDGFSKVHLGSKLEAGIVKWSADTQSKQLALVTAKARDLVKTFLDVDYVTKAVAKIEAKAGAAVDDAEKVIETVGKKLAFSEDERAGILGHFIRGGQMTSGGVLQAITSYSQTVRNADDAFDLEFKAIAAMEHAASLAK